MTDSIQGPLDSSRAVCRTDDGGHWYLDHAVWIGEDTRSLVPRGPQHRHFDFPFFVSIESFSPFPFFLMLYVVSVTIGTP